MNSFVYTKRNPQRLQRVDRFSWATRRRHFLSFPPRPYRDVLRSGRVGYHGDAPAPNPPPLTSGSVCTYMSPLPAVVVCTQRFIRICQTSQSFTALLRKKLSVSIICYTFMCQSYNSSKLQLHLTS